MKGKWSTQKLVLTAMLAALAGVLMSLEFSVPMMPPFYKIDFSDVPSVIALFLLGPVSAAAVEILKILIKLITVGTNTMYVGEFANLIGVALSVVSRTALSCCINAFITLLLYARAMGTSLDAVVQMVASVNPAITNLPTFIILATIPFNVLKLSLNYLVGYFLYNRIAAVVPRLLPANVRA